MNLLAQRLRVFLGGSRRVERVRQTLLLGFAEVVDQKVARDCRNPRNERPLRGVVGGKCPVHLDEHFLGKVFGVVGRSGKAIADVVNTTVVGLNDFFPGRGVPGDTAPDQHRNYLDIFQTKLSRKVAFSLQPSAKPRHSESRRSRGEESAVSLTAVRPTAVPTRQYADVDPQVRGSTART